MKIWIGAVGQKLPAWADAAVDDYVARMPRDYRIELRSVRPEPRNGQATARLQAAEALRLRAALPDDALLVALDEKGKDWTTAQLATALLGWRDGGQEPAFLIGGPDGLDAQLQGQAVLRLRLSSMTLPHALARVVLVEQIYRAWSILASHPYHRA
jgi:23S rRNA (pseudouridine1915-N3)-methyltransferase